MVDSTGSVATSGTYPDTNNDGKSVDGSGLQVLHDGSINIEDQQVQAFPQESPQFNQPSRRSSQMDSNNALPTRMSVEERLISIGKLYKQKQQNLIERKEIMKK